MNKLLGLVLLLIPILLTALVMAILALLVRLYMLANVYRELAQRYSGWLDRHWMMPVLRVTYRGVETKLFSTWFGPGRILRTTQARMAWPDRRKRLLVCSPALLEDLNWHRFGSAMDLPCGQMVSHTFVIFTNDNVWAQKILLGEPLERLQRILANDANQTSWLTIERRRLTLHRAGVLKNRSEIDRLLRDVWRIFDYLVLAQTEGITFISKQGGVTAKNGICPVCGGHVVYPVAMCARCRTPHCQECWEYNEGCAIYACGEKRHV